MLYFKDIELNYKKPSVAWSLSRVKGVGFQRATYVLSTVGISSSFPVANLNFYYFELSCILLKDNYITDQRLLKMQYQRLSFMQKNKITRGIRFFFGLPVNGQRTHSNGKTNKVNKVND